MKREVDGSVVVIANASAPQAADTALDFARRGWFVVLGGISEKALNQLERYIRMNGGVAHVVPGNAETREGRLRLEYEALSWFGRVDEWIDNARDLENGSRRYGHWKLRSLWDC
jgi:NADP-dependent 3-hydroxy acid dehydrogenase YdfG